MIGSDIVRPPISRPPNDPTSLLLNGRVGWLVILSQNLEITLEGSLALARHPESLRSWAEPGGSFGGLALPTNAALASDGTLFLLDPRFPRLLQFDPCACKFLEVPHFATVGNGDRQWMSPHGIAICGDRMFVADSGVRAGSGSDEEDSDCEKSPPPMANNRLCVYTLRGFVLRGYWKPPSSAPLSNPWEPFDIAFDKRGKAYVSDRANGCVHRFAPNGQWETCVSGFGDVTHLAMDCRDRLYAFQEGEPAKVKVMDSDGSVSDLQEADIPERLAPNFPPLPFPISPEGDLHLVGLCAAKKADDPKWGVFDGNGEPLTNAEPVRTPAYAASGVYISQALDSELYRCLWHRAILRGKIPNGGRLQIRTFTAEAELSKSEILNLPLGQWNTVSECAYGMQNGEWDCLIRSGNGRFLWLRVEFRGNGYITPELASVTVEYPRIGLRKYLPAVFGAEPVSADFTDRFLSVFDTTLRGIEHTLDSQARFFDPLSAPAEPETRNGRDFLTWLASWIGVTLDRRWPEAKRRLFLKRAGKMFRIRGTRRGLWLQLLFYLGVDPEEATAPVACAKKSCHPAPANCAPAAKPACRKDLPPLILEHYAIRRWMFLGAGKLSDRAVLWGKSIVNRSQLDENAEVGRTQTIMTQDPYRDPFHVYAHKFSVFLPAKLGRTDEGRKMVDTLLKAETPAHAQCQVQYVEPLFRVGIQAMIGFDSVIARIPRGVILQKGILGEGTVLTSNEHRDGVPGAALQEGTRLGPATRID